MKKELNMLKAGAVPMVYLMIHDATCFYSDKLHTGLKV